MTTRSVHQVKNRK